MNYSIYWINPFDKNYVESGERLNALPLSSSRSVALAGWYATLVWEYGESLELWRCQKRGFAPLRIARRDDGNGVTERATRIRTAGLEKSSSDDSNRLSSQGRGLYR